MESENSTSENKVMLYTCPIFCELGKEYTEPGICPVCDMTLVLVDEKNKSKRVNVAN